MSEKSINDAIKEELIKCKQDPVYFCKKYYMIQHPTKGRVRFNLYPFQERQIKTYFVSLQKLKQQKTW